ncbi:IclR family transcriptional regulator [Natrialbaceae archaeon GCM10025810]|uniref:IclR family transcriptional regulator n=1 Tax=Halovalidus salilacus TaxID=3075124 RepID=UPI0036102153
MTQDVPVKTAKKTLELIETIDHLNGASFMEVMNEMKMPKSTVHDYLQTLLELGYVIEEGGQYYLGTKFLELGERRRRRMKIYQAAEPEIQKLATETGEHSSLMIEENGIGVLLATATGEHALQLEVYPGQRLPLSTSAPGKAILAHLPEEQVEEILDEHGTPAVTPNSITNREVLYEEFRTIRDRGYATDHGERVEGVRAIAVPIISNGTVHGAVGIGGPVQRLTDDRMADELPTLLLETANVIEVNYKYS